MNTLKHHASRLLLAASLLLASCTTDTTEEFQTPAPQSRVTLCSRDDSAFVVTQEAVTRSTGSITEEAATETTIHDLNLYIWRPGTSNVRHIYTSNATDTFFISYGKYEVRAVANIGRSYEEEGITDSPEALDDPERFNVQLFNNRTTRNIMSYRGQFEVNKETTTLEIILTRLVAKISYDIWNASSGSIVFLSAQACNLPTSAGIFPHTSSCYPADDLSYINGEIVESSDGKSLTDTFYMYENLKPENPSITNAKERTPENAPEDATYLLIRFYYTTAPNKIYTARVYLGGGEDSNFTLQRNQQLKLSIPVYSASDIRITYETCTARANNEDIIYSATSREYDHQLANILVETTGSGTSHVGNWWIKPEGPENNDDDYLVYSTDEGATWQPCTPGELMNVYPNATSTRKVRYLFARHLTRNHKNFRKILMTYKFSVYYGDTEKVLLRQVESQRKMYFPLDLDTSGDDGDCYLTRFTINGEPAGDFTDTADFPAWCQDVDIEFNYPAYYTFMGLYHTNGQRIRLEPDDVDEVDGIIYVRYMGVCADHFLQEGPGTLYVTFYLPERVRLRVPHQKGFTITTTFDCAPGEVKRWNDIDNTSDYYEVPFNTEATLMLQSTGSAPHDLDLKDAPFEGWRQSSIDDEISSTLIAQKGTCTVRMTADYTMRPSWYTPIVLDKGATYANCYVVPKAGFYEFNAHHAGSRDNTILPARLEILWQDGLGGGSPQILSRLYYDPTSGRATFLANDQTGSVIIAGYKDFIDPVPVWSWHIWCTENYVPRADTYGLMTRNLGALREANVQTNAEDASAALRAGYIYQGGRHEPFPFIMSEIQDNVNAPATLTLVSSPQIPEGPLEARGGYSTNAWNTETKSTHDPCPYGWRVPTRAQLTSRSLNLFNNLNIQYDARTNRVQKDGIAFPLYGIYYQGNSTYRPECLYNAWHEDLRTTVYAYANGYYEVRAKRQSDTSIVPLILLGTPSAYDTRILGGMVRCIKDN